MLTKEAPCGHVNGVWNYHVTKCDWSVEGAWSIEGVDTVCLACWWNWGFFAIAIAPLLLLWISVGCFCSYPSSLYNDQSQHASCATSDKAMYSASVDDNTTVSCFLDCQVIAPEPAMKTYPVVDLRSSKFPYAVSMYPWNRLDCEGSAVYLIL